MVCREDGIRPGVTGWFQDANGCDLKEEFTSSLQHLSAKEGDRYFKGSEFAPLNLDIETAQIFRPIAIFPEQIDSIL